MSEIATLGIKVDSSDASRAAKSLDNLADFAEKAEKATGSLGGSAQKSAKQYKDLSSMADELAKSERKAVEQIHQRARAYTKSAGAEVAAMRAQEKSSESMRKYALETERLRQGLSKLLSAIDPLESKLNKLDDTEKKLHETFRRGIIDADKYAESLAKIGSQRDEIAKKQLKDIGDGAEYAAGMMEKLGLGTQQARHDLLNLGRAAAQGNFNQVQNSLFSLTRGSSALSAAFSATGLAAGAAVGSIALLGTAYYQGYQRTQEFNRSIALTGNALNTSAAEMAYMTTEVGRLSGSFSQAERAANLIVGSGRIASDSIRDVMQVAVDMQQAFGQSVDETISEFERLGDSPSRTLIELDEKYQFLTAAVLEQVLALEKQGRMEEAIKLAQGEASRALGERTAEVVENVGVMEKAWRGLRGVVAGTWETMLNIGRTQPVATELARINKDLELLEEVEENLDKLQEGFAGSYVAAVSGAGMLQVTGGKNKTELLQRKAELEETLKIQEAEAKAREKDREIEEQKKDAIKNRHDYIEAYSPVTLASELAKANEEFKKATVGLGKETDEYAKVLEAHHNRIEQINKRFTKPTSRAGGGNLQSQMSSEAARLRARIAEETNLSNALENTVAQVTRLNQFERRAMQLREQAEKATKSGTKAKLEELAALNEEAGALVRNNKLAQDAAKERLKYLEGLGKSAQSTRDEAQRLRDQAKTMGMSRVAIEELTTARLQDQIVQLQGKEGTEEEIALIQELIEERGNLTDAIGQYEMARIAHDAQQEMERDWQRTVDNVNDVFRRGFADMLNEGKGSWSSFTKSLATTFKTAVADQIYKMLAQPFVAQIAVGVGGALGFSGAASAAQSGANALGLGDAIGVGSLFTDFSSSMSGMVQNIGGNLASMNGMLGDFGANLVMNADTIGSALDMAGGALSYGMGAYNLAKGNIGSGAGAIAGQFFGGPIGGFLGGTLGGMLDGAFKGETRYGGGFVKHADNRAEFIGGPSGGYGDIDAMDQVLSAFDSSITGVLEALKVENAYLANTVGSFESSKKGRGGTSSGGTLIIDGKEVYFGSAVDGQTTKGAGYGGRSGSAEEMFENMARDMAYSTLEAWQLVADQMPSMIEGMLRDVDVRSMGIEQAEALAAEIQNIVLSTTAFRDALADLPFENLTQMSFEASASLVALFGGVENAMAGLGSYYQNFYSEQERVQHQFESLSRSFAELNVSMPMSRQGFRELAESMDVSTESGQQMYAALIQMSGAASDFYAQIEAQSAAAFESVAAEMQASYDSQMTALRNQHDAYMSALRERHQAQVKALRDEYQQRNKLLRDSMSEAAQRVRDLSQIVKSLETGIKSLRGHSELAEKMYRNSSRAMIEDAIEMAKAGKSLTGLDGLTDAVSAVSKLSTQDFASQLEFELERAESVAALKELEGLTGAQVDVQQLQADLLEKQIEELADWRDKQADMLERQFELNQARAIAQFEERMEREQERFEKEMELAREHFDKQMQAELEAQELLTKVDGSILDGADVITRATESAARQISDAVSKMRINIVNNYGGGSGSSLGSVLGANSRVPAFADGGYHAGGLALVGEKGPELVNFAKPSMIYTAAQSKNLMGSNDESSKEIVALLRQLIAMTSNLSHELKAVAINTAKMYGVLDDVTQGGDTLRTKEEVS